MDWSQPGVWSFRLGQDWALITSPFPGTTSFVVGAGKGNLWMRYPQAKFTFQAGPAKVAVSANRPMAGNQKYDDYAGGDFDIVGDGEITGQPWYMGRTWIKAGPATISFSGHYGKESILDKGVSATDYVVSLAGDTLEVDKHYTTDPARHDVDTWSFNADVVFKTGPVAVTGRYFTGANLNSFFGGVFQGYTTTANSVTSLPASGGWGQVKYSVNDAVSATVGGGMDMVNPDDGVVVSRESNNWMFANVAYKVNKQLSYTLEWENLKTTWVGKPEGVANRVHFVALFKF